MRRAPSRMEVKRHRVLCALNRCTFIGIPFRAPILDAPSVPIPGKRLLLLLANTTAPSMLEIIMIHIPLRIFHGLAGRRIDFIKLGPHSLHQWLAVPAACFRQRDVVDGPPQSQEGLLAHLIRIKAMKDDMDDLGRIFTCLRALVVRLLSGPSHSESCRPSASARRCWRFSWCFSKVSRCSFPVTIPTGVTTSISTADLTD